MLSLLVLAAAPQVPPASTLVVETAGRTLEAPPPGCDVGLRRTAQPVTPGGGLAWREGDPPVRMYLLLERSVGGCPAPIVVMERVPGSNAVGREMGRRFNLELRPQPWTLID